VSKIKELENKYLLLSKRHAQLLAEANILKDKRDYAFTRFAGACRRLLCAKLRKGDTVFLRGKGNNKLTVSGAYVNEFGYRLSSGSEYYEKYYNVSSVKRRGRVVFKNQEWIGSK